MGKDQGWEELLAVLKSAKGLGELIGGVAAINDVRAIEVFKFLKGGDGAQVGDAKAHLRDALERIGQGASGDAERSSALLKRLG